MTDQNLKNHIANLLPELSHPDLHLRIEAFERLIAEREKAVREATIEECIKALDEMDLFHYGHALLDHEDGPYNAGIQHNYDRFKLEKDKLKAKLEQPKEEG